jgi:hypothetical protein
VLTKTRCGSVGSLQPIDDTDDGRGNGRIFDEYRLSKGVARRKQFHRELLGNDVSARVRHVILRSNRDFIGSEIAAADQQHAQRVQSTLVAEVVRRECARGCLIGGEADALRPSAALHRKIIGHIGVLDPNQRAQGSQIGRLTGGQILRMIDEFSR